MSVGQSASTLSDSEYQRVAVDSGDQKIVALIPGAPAGDVSASASTDPDAPLDAEGA